ncbi:hypothetical protein C8A00DRAFT_39406 [Chaetomidium leptoderma]|uniref:Uncharacterized protein n=1 Tax=Chaetomidium leptoderma TaxID=669021 RepID=A0AAN7A050_9PEZI|nr:hypothetical protein C8A00DRAFT_39406 [Chaetomidium leptoderma]
MDPLDIAAHTAALRASCDEVIGSASRILTKRQDLQHVGPVLNAIQLAWTPHGSALMVHRAAGFGMWPNVQKNLESARTSFQALGLRSSSLAVYRERLRAHHMAFRVGATMMKMYLLSLTPVTACVYFK